MNPSRTGAGHDRDAPFGMLDGDMIKVGSNPPVQVTSINYATNVLTLAPTPSITWTNGANVSLPYNGAKPDLGAWESGTSRPSAPPNLRFLMSP